MEVAEHGGEDWSNCAGCWNPDRLLATLNKEFIMGRVNVVTSAVPLQATGSAPTRGWVGYRLPAHQ